MKGNYLRSTSQATTLSIKSKSSWPRLAIYISLALAILLAGASAINHNIQPAHASSSVGFTEFATHPYASNTGYDNTSTNYYTGEQLCPPPATFCPAGQTLIDMNVTADGQLVAGYGDWNSNVDSFGVAAGRVGVMPLDLNTGTWGDMFLAGSEALDVVRKINGHLYIPTTDPSEKAATGHSTGNIPGYITNDTGEWRFVENGPRNSIHVFDVATRDGTDLWTTGSSSDVAGGVAVARQSTDGGETWENSLLGPGGSFDRFYSLASLDDKAYTKSRNTSTPQSFDGTSWSEAAEYPCGMITHPRLVETFQDYIICFSSSNRLQYFDGTTSQATGQLSWTTVKDMFVTADEVYALGGQYGLGERRIYVTSNLSDWQLLDVTIPTGAASLAVYDDRLYIGDDKGVIHRSDSLVSEIGEKVYDIEDCFTFDSSTGVITNYSKDTHCPKDLVIPDYIGGVAVTGIGDEAFSSKGLNSVVIPDSVISIGANAFAADVLTAVTIGSSVESIGEGAFHGNQLTSIAIPDSVISIGDRAFFWNYLTSVTIGASVESIGEDAFYENNLTSVSIPDSVISIGESAFSLNNLTSVTIGNSVESIGYRAFRSNNLTSVTIPDSVISIGEGAFSYSNITHVTLEGTPILGRDVFMSRDSERIVKVYAPEVNPYDNQLYESWDGSYYQGGHIINPASITTHYVDSSGNQLQPSTQVFGQNVGDYLMGSLIAIKPDLVADDLADLYYTSGHTYTATPQDIDGYTTPDPQTITLATGNNDITFTYTAQGQSGEDEDNANTGSDVGAPNTGAGAVTTVSLLLAGAAIVVVGLIASIRLKRTR